MKAADTIRECSKRAGISFYRIALNLNKNSQYITSMISQNTNPQVNTLAKILNECGYDLVAVPEDEVTDDMLVID